MYRVGSSHPKRTKEVGHPSVSDVLSAGDLGHASRIAATSPVVTSILRISDYLTAVSIEPLRLPRNGGETRRIQQLQGGFALAIKWTKRGLEDLRGIGERDVQAKLYEIAMKEINLPRYDLLDIEGSLRTDAGLHYWRRAIYYAEIDDYRAYSAANDGGDEFQCRADSYFLIYRPAQPSEYRDLQLPSASVLITNIVYNNDGLEDIREGFEAQTIRERFEARTVKTPYGRLIRAPRMPPPRT